MEIFLNTGQHPELDKKVEQERGVYDDAGKLPQRNAHRPHVFMSVQTSEGNIGHTQIELFDDKTPIASRAFRLLCTGTGEDGFTKGACYRGVPFFRLQKDSFVEGGRIETSQHSQAREGFDKGPSHSCGGIVSMKPTSTEFTITLAPAPELDSTRIVVGRIVSGHAVLEPIAEAWAAHLKDEKSPPPVVVDCGMLAAGGISEAAMERLYTSRLEGNKAEAEAAAAIENETPQQTAERLRKEAAERRDAVQDALLDGLNAANKRQATAQAGPSGAKRRAMWDTLGSDASDTSSGEEEEEG